MEIKFKAKVKGSWQYGFITKWADGYQIWVTDEDGETHNYIIDEPDTISQYIGIKDKNGRQIYSGNKIRCEKFDVISVVNFEYGAFVMHRGFKSFHELIAESEFTLNDNNCIQEIEVIDDTTK